MRAIWLSLALVSVVPGCFGSHDGGDRPPEPPTCAAPGPAGGWETGLSCPPTVSAGTEAFVEVASRAEICCLESAVTTPSVSRSGTTFEVSAAWEGCDCCIDHCGCVPSDEPVEVQRVSLGLLVPGWYEVVAGEGPTTQRCMFFVEGPPAMCDRHAADEVRRPRVIFDDQSFSVTARTTSGLGCGCTPQLADSVGASPQIALDLCGCCEGCECVDPGYEASRNFGRFALGDHSVSVPDGAMAEPLSVRTRGQCHPVTATGITVVGPDDSLRRSGPRLWWARVEGEEALCCVTPMPAVETVRGPPSEIRLQLSSCVEIDCDCVPRLPSPFSTWYDLGELAPGTYVVSVGEVRTSFVVP